MPTDGTIIITNAGHAKLNLALGTASKVEITHVAMGDGLGAAYIPAASQTVLKRERTRVPIKSRHVGGASSWRIKAEFLADQTPVFTVREIGFFDANGTLIFIWAGTDIQSRQTGGSDYLLDHALVLDRIREGLVIVTAPDDDVFELAAGTARAVFVIYTEQLRQARLLETLT